MAICPKCGKEVPDGATFCGACGAQMSADGVSSASSASFCPKCGESVPAGAAACPKCGAALNAEPEKKGFQAPPKKTLMIGGAAVVVVIAAVAAFSMLSGGGSGADYALYLKDDQLVYTTLKEEGDWDVTSDLADGEEVTASDAFELSLLVTMSEDGKRIFFPDRGGDAIYYRETGDPEGEAVRVDTDMSDYAINASGTLVTYLKDSDLYQSDLTDKERIASDVEAFWVTNDGKTVTYFNTDDGYYRWTSGSESEKLVSNITNIEYVSDDLSEVLYVKDGSLYRQTGTEEPVKITSDVENVVRILDSGELYYTKSASDDLSVMDYIEDDLASSDAAMQPVEYPDYVWSFEYDTTEAYEAAKAQRDQQMEAYNAYRDKLDRDEMREELKESTISQNRYELYYYNGTEETLVTDSLAYGSLTASAADKAVAVIEVRDEASASKVKISEIEYAYEAESRVFSVDQKDRDLRLSDLPLCVTLVKPISGSLSIYTICNLDHGKCRQMIPGSEHMGENLLGRRKSTVRNNALYLSGQRQTRCHQNGCPSHRCPMQKDLYLIRASFYRPVDPAHQVTPVQASKPHVLAFALSVGSGIRKKHCIASFQIVVR